MKNLLDAGCDINSLDRWTDSTPIIAAVSNNRVKCVEFLLVRGADINSLDSTCWSALGYAVMNLNVNMISLLLSHGANVNGAGYFGDALIPLYQISKGISGVKYHMNVDENIIEQNISDVIQLLLRFGADPNLPNWRGITAKDVATKHGNYYIVDLFSVGRLTKGAKS